MTDSPLATPTIALQCDHPPLARTVEQAPPQRASAPVPPLLLHAAYPYKRPMSVVHGAAYRYARPHGVVPSAGLARPSAARPTAVRPFCQGGTFV